MKLLEYEAKKYFERYGIPTPEGRMFTDPRGVKSYVEKLGGQVAVKAQIPVGGRGKAGGILFADSPGDASREVERLLGSRLKDLEVRKVLVEERLEILRELYLGVTVDRTGGRYVVLASSEGGVEIEEIAAETPERIVKHGIDPIHGFRSFHANQVASELGYSGRKLSQLSGLLLKLYDLAMDIDVELTEINPLAETAEGFVAADARLNVDNNSLFRHEELRERYAESYQGELTGRELEALREGLTYVELDGNIGIIGNGAGLTMATLDSVTLHGGSPSNFLDLGGGASKETVKRSLEFVLNDPRVDVIFINVLGGITRADDIARGIIEARGEFGERPMVVRLMGTNEEEGKLLLREEGIEPFDSMEEAAAEAVRLTEED